MISTNNNKLIWMYLLSFRIDYVSFQSPITLQTRASLFHIKFYGVLIDNTVISDSSMHSILWLLLLLEPLFQYLKTIVTMYNSLVW